MWSSFARMLDRFAIRSACGSVLPSPDGCSHASEAAALLRGAGFFNPPVAVPQLEFVGKRTFQFASPIPSGHPGNNLVHGRCVLAKGAWQRRPSIILLHGWNAELQDRWLCPYWGRLLSYCGVNAFMFELPFHGRRRPTTAGAIRNYLSGDLLHVMRATNQTLAEVRALALWLRAQGSPSVGLWGVSLGAWLAGLAAAHQREIELAVLMTPVVRMDRALRDLPFCEAIRDDLRGLDDEFRLLNLVEHPVGLTPEKMLVVAAEHDLFAAPETIREFAAAWQPEVWWLPHGHISVLAAPGVMPRIAKWVAARIT